MSQETITNLLSDLISIKAAAFIHDVSPQAVDYRIRKGDLKVTQIAGHNFVSARDVLSMNFRESSDGAVDRKLIPVKRAVKILKTTVKKFNEYVSREDLKVRRTRGGDYVYEDEVNKLRIVRHHRGRVITIEQAARLSGTTPGCIRYLVYKEELQLVHRDDYQFILKTDIMDLAASVKDTICGTETAAGIEGTAANEPPEATAAAADVNVTVPDDVESPLQS